MLGCGVDQRRGVILIFKIDAVKNCFICLVDFSKLKALILRESKIRLLVIGIIAVEECSFFFSYDQNLKYI